MQIGNRDSRGATEADAALAGKRQGVQFERPHIWSLQHQVEKLRNIAIVQSHRHGRQNRGGDIVLLEQIEDGEFRVHRVCPEHDLIDRGIEGIQRQHDARIQRRQLADVGFIQ